LKLQQVEGKAHRIDELEK